MRLGPSSSRSSSGLSLVELLVTLAVIASLLTFLVPVIENWRGIARQAAIAQQEKQINQVYRSLKATRATMPSTLPEILNVLSTDPMSGITPPPTMTGPTGPMTLTFDAGREWFSYVEAEQLTDI